MNNPHLFFLNPPEGVAVYNPPSRKVEKKEDEDEKIKSYVLMQESLLGSLTNFYIKLEEKNRRRNPELDIPAKIDYIKIDFFGSFDTKKFESKYRNNFGLLPIRYDRFNSVGYFAIADEELFKSFVGEINYFLKSDDPKNDTGFNHDILFIKHFSLHSSEDIKLIDEQSDLYVLNLFDSYYLQTRMDAIRNALIKYLNERNIKYFEDTINERIELIDTTIEIINEITDNFDIIHTINSPVGGVIRPSVFNLPIKEFGFEIINSGEDLPLIGIIDTGISDRTPLSPLIINNQNEFDITGTSPRVDNVNHGTGVAAIAALGKNLYTGEEKVKADAKLLSIKVLDNNKAPISESTVVQLIRKANTQYGIKIFVLTLGYINCLADNSLISNYAYSLDVLANELDILIFISAGNYKAFHNFYDYNNKLIRKYPTHFMLPQYNICSPADSMNNISCGAISDNLEPFHHLCFSLNNSFPATYSRKFNVDRNSPFFSPKHFSKHLGKPDLCSYGGDIDAQSTLHDLTGLKVLDAKEGIFFSKEIGTSYSAPFLANLAARIIKEYPLLNNNMQSVKALLINSSVIPQAGDVFENLNSIEIKDLLGKGIPDDFYSIYSDENTVTMILEDSIKPDEIKAYPFKIPEYLNSLDNSRLLHFNATLCFDFEPIPHNHLCYCPLHIAFGIFRNIPFTEKQIDDNGKEKELGLCGTKTNDYKVFQSWSEDFFSWRKLYCNCQKISFGITKQKLVDENNQFKIAIRSRLHSAIPIYLKDKYSRTNDFSIAITIKELPYKHKLTGKLYNELTLINNLYTEAELSAEVDLDLNS